MTLTPTTSDTCDMCDKSITVNGKTTIIQVAAKVTKIGYRSFVTVIYGPEKDQRYSVKGDVDWVHYKDAIAEAVQKRKDMAAVDGAELI